MVIRPIVKIHGGKSYLTQWLYQHFPPDIADLDFYDVCGGAGTVTLRKQPSKTETYNDLDPALFNLMWVVANRGGELIERLAPVQYDQATFAHFKASESTDSMDRAVREVVVRRMSRGGLGGDFSYSARLRGGQPGDVNAWETWKRHLPLITRRFATVQIVNMAATDLIKERDHAGAFFYIDPPYLPRTRSVSKAYSIEMSEKQHKELGAVLQNLQGRALVSGYDSPLYNKLFKGWRRGQRVIANHSGQGKAKQLRLECVWHNYAP